MENGNGPRCIQNIENICKGLELVRVIKQHEYIKVDDLDIVLKTMYPHARYNDPVPIKHGSKCRYKARLCDNIRETRYSLSTLNKLVGPIYNFDIANPEYIEPNSLSLEELIPALAEFITNRKYPEDADTELISIGKPIKTKLTSISLNHVRAIIAEIVKLLSYNNTALHDKIDENVTKEYALTLVHREEFWGRFERDPNFRYISSVKNIRRSIAISSAIAVIYELLIQNVRLWSRIAK